MDNYRFYKKLGIDIYLHKYMDAILEGITASANHINCGDFYGNDFYRDIDGARNCHYCQRSGGSSAVDGRGCPIRLWEKARECYNENIEAITKYLTHVG